MSWAPRRRFWTRAGVRPEAGGFGVALDARTLQTPARAPLVVPTEALAAAIAGEWNAVEAEILPERLLLTRAANSAIDRVARNPAAVAAAIAAYGDADLICYRAEAPEGLRAHQAAGWDPWLAWSAAALEAPLEARTGVVYRPQPAASLAALGVAVTAQGPFGLTALHELVTISGSLVLALAVARGALDGAAAWELSRIDESWQSEHWGRDAEAEAAAARKRRDFLAAEEFLVLLGRAAAR
jgi:chaperone required for assembly of F1-ATPase